MATLGQAWTCESFSDPSRAGFKMVMNFLKSQHATRVQAKETQSHVERLPCRVSGEELRKLEGEFGWKLTVVDRGPTMSTYAVAKHHLLAAKNRQIKTWDGEEVIEFDRELMSMAVKHEGWLHTCRTFSSAAVAVEYQRQEYALTKAVEGQRADISLNATELLRQVRVGGADRLCMDASRCTHIADTLLVDLTKVCVSATQLAATILQHQAHRAKVFFYFEPDMYVQDEGELSSMPGRYMIDRATDRLFIFPDGQTVVHYATYFSSVLSYLLEAEVVCQGRRFAIEIHDSQPGVMFAQLVLLEHDAAYDTEIETRFYRPSGEPMRVYEQYWIPPGATGQEFSRIVVPERLGEKVESRLKSYPLDKVSLENARIAVRDYTNQDVIRTTTIVQCNPLGVHVPELLAQAVHKKALRERFEMQVEQRYLSDAPICKGLEKSRWVHLAVAAVLSTARSVYDAVSSIPDDLLAGFGVSEDYTVRDYSLEAGYVVRNLLSSGHVRDTTYRSVSYMPGGQRTGSTVSSNSTTDDVLLRARAFEYKRALDEADEVFHECAQVSEDLEPKRHAPMTSERIALVEKMRDEYDAHDSLLGKREVHEVHGLSAPVCSLEPIVDQPSLLINDEYFQVFPELKGVDAHVHAHVVAVEDRHVSIQAPLMSMNRARDELPKSQRVRKPKELTVAGGRRPVSQLEGVLAFSKRVANAPRAQAERDFETVMTRHFDRFQKVCFRAGWQKIVAARVTEGMWASRRVELERNVHKLDTSKVTSMLREAFSLGKIDMTAWRAIVKPVPKPQMSAAAANDYKGTQTIVYQENKMTNSMCSSILTEFHDTVDEILEPNVRINVRRSTDDAERWFNSWEIRRISAGLQRCVYESDVSQCDKSHTIYNLLAYFHFLRQLGAPDDLIDVWSVMIGKKTASAAMVGMMIQFFEQLTSGAFLTISLNSIVVALAIVNSMELEKSKLITLQVTGDDTLLEVVGDIPLYNVTESMRDSYNFESKTYKVDVPYFCSRYYVYYDGYWFLVKDPIKAAESKGRFIAASADLVELHRAYCDDMRHYEKKEVLDQLASAVMIRNEYCILPRGLIRGLSAYRDYDKFVSSYFDEEEMVV